MTLLLVDLQLNPAAPEASRSRILIDSIFASTTGDGSLQSHQMNQTVTHAEDRAAWRHIRQRRAQAWRSAGLDPDSLTVFSIRGNQNAEPVQRVAWDYESESSDSESSDSDEDSDRDRPVQKPDFRRAPPHTGAGGESQYFLAQPMGPVPTRQVSQIPRGETSEINRVSYYNLATPVQNASGAFTWTQWDELFGQLSHLEDDEMEMEGED